MVSGWFENTLNEQTKARLDSAAIYIYVDCDIYESSVAIFDFITNLTQDGTVIIIDDYFRYKGIPDRGVH